MHDPIPTLSVVAGESDSVKATRYKQELAEPLAKICEIFTSAKKDNIALNFAVNFDGLGKAFVAQLGATKEL